MANIPHTTLAYKRLPGLETPIHVDIYLPTTSTPAFSLSSTPKSRTSPLIPAVIYFHGGGLTVGNRESWFPTWLHKRVTSAGFAFISADYQLLPPATGHDIVQDISDLMVFLVGVEVAMPLIDPNAIAISGSSAGGLCAYLAAMHCTSPKPRAVLSMYGMGGNFLTGHYLLPKTKPFFRGRELLDPTDPSFASFLHPACTSLAPISDSPLAYHGSSYVIPGYPANPRMLLARLFLQMGVFLDYYTGEHDVGGVSEALRGVLEKGAEGDLEDTKKVQDAVLAQSLLPAGSRSLFPQFGVSACWPPTMFCHGTRDSAVPVGESRFLAGLLRDAGVEVEVLEFEGEEHSFDYEAGVEERYGVQFDAVGAFLRRWVGGGGDSE